MPSIREEFENEEFYFQQDGAPPHYHCNVRSFLDEILPNRWIGRRGFVEYFFLCGCLKDRVYTMRPETVTELRAAIVRECRGIVS